MFLRSESTTSLMRQDWTFGAVTSYLDSFGPSDTHQTGSAPDGRQARHSLVTHDTVVTPQILYARDDIRVTVGTTPLGGTVAPLPTVNALYKDTNVSVEVFNEPVKDSLLSYVGFRDIYSGRKMGRVLKTGVKLGWEDTFDENWFYGGALTGSYFYGRNTEGNEAAKAEAYIGRTFGSVSVGLYSSFDHFTHDLNHFTYGHGGYYSPDIAAAGAAFASWEVKDDDMWLKTDMSLGYLYEKTRDTPMYFNGGGSGQVYEGESHKRITLNTGLEAGVNLTESTSLSGIVRFLNSGPFNETKLGLTLGYGF